MRKPSRQTLYHYYIVRNMTRSQVAGTLGLSDSYIKQLLMMYGIRKAQRRTGSKKREWTLATYTMVLEDISKGMTIREIAQFYDRDEDEVRENIKKAFQTGLVKRIPKPYEFFKEYSEFVS